MIVRQVITLPKVGDGYTIPIKPDIEEGVSWQKVDETETEMTIEILDDPDE